MKQPLFKLAVPILALPRAAKRFVALSVDLGLCVLTVWLAFYLRLGEFVVLSGAALWAVVGAVGIIQPILLLLFVGASRALARVWLGGQYLSILKGASRPKVLIYGAGTTGRQLAAAMANSHEMQVVGFLDDDDRLHGHVLNGQPTFNPAGLKTA